MMVVLIFESVHYLVKGLAHEMDWNLVNMHGRGKKGRVRFLIFQRLQLQKIFLYISCDAKPTYLLTMLSACIQFSRTP
jgi:hypothetical protein